MNIESVDDRAAAFGAWRDQGLTAFGLLDDVQHRILGIRRLLVGEIHARCEADIDAARGEPEIDVRRHAPTSLATHHGSRLDRADGIDAGGEIGSRARPSAEAFVEPTLLLVGPMVVTPGRIRLPGLDEHIPCRMAGPVEDAALDGDPLSRDARSHDVAAEVVREDFDARLFRNEADMHVWARRL